MLSIRLTLESEAVLWPLSAMASDCLCENSTGKRYRFLFLSLWITREKVAT